LLRDILNKILWDERERQEEYEVLYIHRGAKKDRQCINCSKITRVTSSYFTFQNDLEVVIPLHRVLEVKKIKDGPEMWRKHLG
jgi:uncharacterized protein (UPF0248 family)